MKFWILLVATLGIVLQLAVISPSGLKVNSDLLFWSSHGHDGIWHIAVANELQRTFPPLNPIFAGEKLVNYHFFSDIPLAFINSLTGIPKITLYFHILPVIYSFFLGYFAYKAGKELGRNKLTGLFSVFAVYFIGSFGFIVTLLQNRGVGGESLFWATQVQSSIGNPPQILANIFLLAFTYYLARYLQGGSLQGRVPPCQKLLLTLLPALASASKIYAGLVIYPALLIVAMYRYIATKKTDLLIISVISGLLTLAIYLPFTKSAGSFLIWEPLWYGKRLFLDAGRIGIPNFAFILQHYESLTSIKSYIGLFVKYNFPALLLMIFGNLGVRSLGFLAIPVLFKKNKLISIFLLATAGIAFIIPNLFLQKGVATNTSQTFQYMLLVFGLYFALATSSLFSKIHNLRSKTLFLIVVFALSIPTQIGLLHEFYRRPAFAKISRAELEALSFIKNNYQGNQTILTPPYDRYYEEVGNPTPHIWDWFDTSYVAALSEKQTYFADYEQVDIMGYDYQHRKNIQESIFQTEFDPDMFKQEKINLIYFPKTRAPKTNFSTIPTMKKVYNNSEVEIWEIK